MEQDPRKVLCLGLHFTYKWFLPKIQSYLNKLKMKMQKTNNNIAGYYLVNYCVMSTPSDV